MKTEIIFEIDNEYDAAKIEEIICVLIEKGALIGVKGGQTLIHFDGTGEFMGISFNYWPWRKKSH